MTLNKVFTKVNITKYILMKFPLQCTKTTKTFMFILTFTKYQWKTSCKQLYDNHQII